MHFKPDRAATAKNVRVGIGPPILFGRLFAFVLLILLGRLRLLGAIRLFVAPSMGLGRLKLCRAFSFRTLAFRMPFPTFLVSVGVCLG